MAALLVDGGTRAEAEALFVDATLPDDVMAEFEAGADAQAAAFAAPGAMDRITEHPAGDFPVPLLLGFRIGDWTVHAWDLARAIGADETLPEELVAHVWEGIEPLGPILAASGRFGDGASGAIGEQAPLQTRLLDATGRRPVIASVGVGRGAPARRVHRAHDPDRVAVGILDHRVARAQNASHGGC